MSDFMDFMKWRLETQQRQTTNELLEELKWQRMTPAERAAESARRAAASARAEQEGEKSIKAFFSTLIVAAALLGGVFLFFTHKQHQENERRLLQEKADEAKERVADMDRQLNSVKADIALATRVVASLRQKAKNTEMRVREDRRLAAECVAEATQLVEKAGRASEDATKLATQVDAMAKGKDDSPLTLEEINEVVAGGVTGAQVRERNRLRKIAEVDRLTDMAKNFDIMASETASVGRSHSEKADKAAAELDKLRQDIQHEVDKLKSLTDRESLLSVQLASARENVTRVAD